MKKRNLLLTLASLCIFSIFLDKAIRGAFAFDFYYYYPVFILFLLTLAVKRGNITLPPSWFNRGFSVIFLSSFMILLANDMLAFEFWKQVFGILFTAIVYYNVLFVFEFDLKRVFNIYLSFAFYVALFGVVDNALHMVGIHITDAHPAGGFMYREYSIMGEPFYLTLALTPAIGYYLLFFSRTWKQNKIQFLTILACYLLTYSSIAVTGLALSVFFSLYFNDFFNAGKNKIILVPLLLLPMILFINFLINNVDLINARFTDTTELFFSSELQTQEAGSANASTFALYSNYIIAKDSFLNDPLFGSGLGSHPLIYRNTFLKYFPSQFLERFGAQNQQDANSKFLRLMSETGLLGLVLFMAAFITFFARKQKLVTNKLKELGAINYSIFIYILLCLIRNGNYINVGFLLFMFIYYLSWRQIKTAFKDEATSKPISQELYAEPVDG